MSADFSYIRNLDYFGSIILKTSDYEKVFIPLSGRTAYAYSLQQ